MELRAGSYLAFASAATPAGQYGMQLWLNLDLDLSAKDRRRKLARHHFAVTVSEPRLLVVTCTAPFFKCACVIGHGVSDPSRDEGRRELARACWQRLGDALMALPTGHRPLLLLDANAKLGPAPQSQLATAPLMWKTTPRICCTSLR